MRYDARYNSYLDAMEEYEKMQGERVERSGEGARGRGREEEAERRGQRVGGHGEERRYRERLEERDIEMEGAVGTSGGGFTAVNG